MATEVAKVLQGLECSMCLNLLEEPKLLSCTHSFCEKCLQHLHQAQGTANNLTCPLCLKVTRLGSEGLSSLKTNVPLKSMVGDVKTSRKLCTLCDPEAKSPAAYYCQQCDEYLCEGCLKGHTNYKKNANHAVVSVSDIKSGKVKVKQMCHKHAGEERIFVCTSCKVSICFRCRMLYHNGSDHVIQEVDAFKTNMKDEIESLKKKGLEKIEKVKSYTKVVTEQSAKVEAITAERKADINKAFDETLLQLNAKKNTLLDRCDERKIKLREELCKYGKIGDDLITSISSACELVGNGVRALLEGEALVVHSNLCEELQDMLDRDDPDESKPKQVTSQAEAVTFTSYRLDDAHNLGVLNVNDWKLEKVADFPTSREKPNTLAQTKYGKMLVGNYDGGIEEFTVSGPQKTVLKDTNVWKVSVLSDGRYVVRDEYDKISFYSSDWSKTDIKEFDKKYGGSLLDAMDVDIYDNIYVGYFHNKTINVFTPEDGAPIREIPCHGYSPHTICTMNHSNMLVVCASSTVRVIDQEGTVKYDVTKECDSVRPAVLYDDSILIGWRKDGLVSIDLYTNQLRHVRTVMSGLECKSGWWELRQFSSGAIALCDGSKFYVLRKSYLFNFFPSKSNQSKINLKYGI